METVQLDISDRIYREAKRVGLSNPARVSMDEVSRRRVQLWVFAGIALVALAAVAILISWSASGDGAWIDTTAVRVVFLAVAVGCCVYAVEQEIHLDRLSGLLFEAQQDSASLASEFHELQSIFGAMRAVNSVLELEEVLDVILSYALEILDSSEGSIMLLEGEEELRAVAVFGSDLARNARAKLGESVAGKVARTRQPVVLNGDVHHEFPGHQRRALPVASAMVVPLVNRGELLGVLNVNARPGRRFSDVDLRILTVFAEPVAAAIANAYLYEAERDHVAQLLELDRMKSQFVASVSHELRTPLTSIRGALSALGRVSDLDQQAELLAVIDRQSKRLTQMVEEMLQSAQMERPGSVSTPTCIDLAALIRLVALDSHVAGRSVEVEGPDACPVHIDPEAVRRIVGNLIDNAHKYGAAPVRVVLDAESDRVLISVLDHGGGVPVDERLQIFDRFYRSDATRNKPGLGLGLSIVRSLADACGGAIWVDEAPGGGAAFRVAIPVDATSVPEVSIVR